MFPPWKGIERGKLIDRGYRSGVTPRGELYSLERRVADLERWRREVEARAEWRWYLWMTAFLVVGIAVVVYLAASLD